VLKVIFSFFPPEVFSFYLASHQNPLRGGLLL